VIKDAEAEVARQERREVAPVTVFERFGRVVDEVDGIHPHVTSVVGEIDRDFGVPVGEEIVPVRCIQSRGDGLLAEDTDLVEVGAGAMVRLSGQEVEVLHIFLGQTLFFSAIFCNLEALDYE